MARSTLYDRVEEIRGFKYIVLESGRKVPFWDTHKEAKTGLNKFARWAARMHKTAINEFEIERIEWMIDELERLVNIHRKEIEKWRARYSKEERIAALRNVSGRTSEEAKLYLEKADELEATL